MHDLARLSSLHVHASAPIPSILHLGFIPIKVNTQLCLKAAPLGPRPSAAAGSDEGLLPGRMRRALSASPAPQSAPSARCPAPLPHPSPLLPNVPGQRLQGGVAVTPPPPLAAPFTSFLHLPHIIYCFFVGGGVTVSTCSLPLAPLVVFIFAVSASLSSSFPCIHYCGSISLIGPTSQPICGVSPA